MEGGFCPSTSPATKASSRPSLGVMAMVQAVIPQMRARRSGVIVNVTSSVTLANTG